ncbi:DNA-binding response regulator, partial [Pseudomonas sp. MWU13-2625]
ETTATVRMTMRAGALGFLGKSEGLGELPYAVRVVARGRNYVSAELSARMESSASCAPCPSDETLERGDTMLPTDTGLAGELGLTPREHEVLRCFLAGMSVSDIASKFSRSPKTISAQKQSALRKLSIRNDAELFASRKLIEDSLNS